MRSKRHRDRRPDDWLEQELYVLGREIDYPPSPDVTAQIRHRLVQRPAGPKRQTLVPRSAAWRVAAALSVFILVLGTTLALTPATREALAGFFGLEHIEIVQDDVVETPSPGSEPQTALTGATTLSQARQTVDFPIRLPAYPDGLGGPDEVYVQELGLPEELQVILRYFARPGLSIPAPGEGNVLFTLYQFRVTGAFTKGVSAGTRLQEVSIHGARGFWLEGAFHLLRYRTADGREVTELRRQIEGNTLAWEVDEITYRLETSLPLEEARKIAESLR